MNRLGRTIGEIAMALVGLVLAHNLVFLAGYGAAYGQALAHTGHDHGWSAAVLAVLVMGGCLLLAAAWRLRQLDILARHLASQASQMSLDEPDWARLARTWLALSLRLALAITVLFVVQENIEHLRMSGNLPGLSVLAAHAYPNALPFVALVAMLVAAVGVLFRWRRDVLVARIRAATRAWGRGAPAIPRPLRTFDRRPRGVFRGGLAVRAPPLGIES